MLVDQYFIHCHFQNHGIYRETIPLLLDLWLRRWHSLSDRSTDGLPLYGAVLIALFPWKPAPIDNSCTAPTPRTEFPAGGKEKGSQYNMIKLN